ncbi:MAG: S4 domain-containing protein [uncultured Campylobacterales bacterium]|uniref:S4 domain-containing protein n=1 Tax=uncultured Campylobacterales bacterium TaxID=352960 RepID=A0A6S6TGL3_9BACT|nr:MAG: S4 domain-containing protein [uncultured Campylobacterales bacterium]
MRIDKFLSAVNIVKKRSIALDMCKSKVIFVNEVQVKPSKEVNVGDNITIKYLESEKKYKVILIPKVKSTPKSEQGRYVELI